MATNDVKYQNLLALLDNDGLAAVAIPAGHELAEFAPHLGMTMVELAIRLKAVTALLNETREQAKVILRTEPDNLLREKLLVALSDV